MDDTLENDMVSGSGYDRALSRVLRNDKGPTWDMRKPTWAQYWYDMYLFLCLMGFKDTFDGTNRMDIGSAGAGCQSRHGVDVTTSALARM